jgi:preprotein translocase subunit YajC
VLLFVTSAVVAIFLIYRKKKRSKQQRP